MSFVPPGHLTRDQLVELVCKNETSERPLASPLDINDLRARGRRVEARRAKSFKLLQAPLYTGAIGAIVLQNGHERRVPKNVWGGSNAAGTFQRGYASFYASSADIAPCRGRVFFNRADAEAWLDEQADQLDPKPSIEPRKPPPTHRELVKFLCRHADGEKTESECRCAAGEYFERPISDGKPWRDAWREVPKEQKRPRGAPAAVNPADKSGNQFRQ